MAGTSQPTKRRWTKRMSPTEIKEFLLLHTIKTMGNCFEFTYGLQYNGYAKVTIKGVTDYAHRHMYRLSVSEIPKGFNICHHCDNRKCINPEHLFLGTQSDNIIDCVNKGRHRQKLTKSLQKECLIRIKKGMQYKDIAKEFNVTKSTISRFGLKNGVNRNIKVKTPIKTIQKISRLLKLGLTKQEISIQTDLHIRTIYRIIQRSLNV